MGEWIDGYWYEFMDSYFSCGLFSITIITDFVVQIVPDFTNGCAMVLQPTIISLIYSQRHP